MCRHSVQQQPVSSRPGTGACRPHSSPPSLPLAVGGQRATTATAASRCPAAWRRGSVQPSHGDYRAGTHTLRASAPNRTPLHCSAVHCTSGRSASAAARARRLTESGTTGKMARWVGLTGVSDGVSNQKHKHELACMHQYLKFTFERFVVLCLTGPNGQERKREKKANFVRSLLCCSRSVIRRTGLSGWVCVRDSRVVPLQAV